MTFEYNNLELERKLQASLLSNKVQAEVMKRLDWYRTQLMLAKYKIDDLEEQLSNYSWLLNPDRTWGAYTPQELETDWK